MKSNVEEPSNIRLTLVKVGRRSLVRIARRLTGFRPIDVAYQTIQQCRKAALIPVGLENCL